MGRVGLLGFGIESSTIRSFWIGMVNPWVEMSNVWVIFVRDHQPLGRDECLWVILG